MAIAPDVRPSTAATGSSVPPLPGARAVRPAAAQLRSGIVGLVVAAVTGALVVALVVGGGAPVATGPGLPDAGPVTGWGLPAAELVARLLAVVVVGRLVLAAVLVPAGAAGDPRARRVVPATTGWVVLWLSAEVAALLLTASSLYAVPVTGLSGSAVVGLLTTLPVGRAAAVVALLLLALVLGCAAATRTWHARLLLPVALVAVTVPVVLGGHSAGADDHLAAVTTLTAHVVSASVWVGGLAALLSTGRGHAWTTTAVRRFSTLALGCVAVLAITGVLAAVLLGGSPTWAVLTHGWGRLLGAKTILLLALAGLGLAHRRRTLPALAAGRPGALLRLGAVEVALMAVTIAVSVALSASPAPAPAQAPEDRAPSDTGPVGGEGGPGQARQDAAPDSGLPSARSTGRPADGAAPAGTATDDMSGHDHGELSVTVLVDDERFHVSGPVRPGQRVTVYNGSTSEVTLTATDGSFDATAPARTFITFEAPAVPGSYRFASSHDVRFSDRLTVRGD